MLSKNVIVLPEFATSTRVFREVIGTSAKAFKKMSSLEVVASSSLPLRNFVLQIGGVLELF